MKAHYLCVLAAALGVGTWLAGDRAAQTREPAPRRDQAAEPAPPQGVDVMARGPVHEAYAEPINPKPEASPVVPKQPPEPVPETPPDQKPEGDNVQWIPGYWAWDDASQDFLWVSGFWRNVPPGQQWVPGHWEQAHDGWQWVPGFWNSADQNQMEYLPPPPASIDSGPSTPAPDDDSLYVPGCWVFQETRYLWRPGFWMAYKPDWMWCPAHYVWCPAGYVFVEGFWDHPLGERGLLFAPCRFERDLLVREDFVYTPSYVVQPDFLMSALFVRPANYCYYFGDYFDRRFEDLGYIPWVDYRISRTSFDPLFTHYSHAFGEERWGRSLRELYRARSEGQVARPPHTLAEQRQVINQITEKGVENARINKNINVPTLQMVQALAPISRVNNMRVTALASLGGVKEPRNAPVVQLQAVSREQRTAEVQHAAQLREAAQHRREVEAKLRTQEPAPGRPAEQPKRATLDLPKAPAAPARPERPAAKPPPPRPQPPNHEERPIPKAEPPKPQPEPLKKETRPPEPPTRESPPAPRPEPKPPEPSHERPTPPKQLPPPRPEEPRPPTVTPREKPPERPHSPTAPPPEPRREPPPPRPNVKPPEPPHHEAPRPEPPPKERPHPPPH